MCFRLGIIFQGLDGWRIPTKVTYGHLEVFAWKENTMPATVHSLTQLGPNVENEKMEMILASTTEDMFVKVWVSVDERRKHIVCGHSTS